MGCGDGEALGVNDESIGISSLSTKRTVFGGIRLNPELEVVDKFFTFGHARQSHVPRWLAVLKAWLSLVVDAALLILRV